MTLCIAAICRESNSPRFVLCSDTLASYGELGSRNRAIKFDVLGAGWTVQLAGTIPLARDYIEAISAVFSDPATSLRTRTEVRQAVSKALIDAPRPLSGSLLLSGFLGTQPYLLAVFDGDNGTIEVQSSETYAAVGEGQDIAVGMLNYRDYHENLPIQTATYLIYEAKRIAEIVRSVGKLTVLLWQAPPIETTPPNKAMLNMVNPAGLAVLEQLYGLFGPQPIPNIQPFPRELFTLPEIKPPQK